METSNTSPTLTGFLITLAMGVAGGLGAWLKTVWDQRAPLSLALVDKTKAETRAIDAEVLAKAWDRIDELEKITRALTSELYDERASCIEARTRLSTQEIELTLQTRDIKKLRAILVLHNLKFSDYDHIKVD